MSEYLYEPNNESDYDYEDSIDTEICADQSSMLIEKSFLGEYPFSEIVDGICNQFHNYMSTDDRSNYVDIFYNQLSHSLASIDANGDEDGAREYLGQLEITFTDEITTLLQDCIGIGIDDGTELAGTLRDVLEAAYEYFILDAKKNFKIVISSNIMRAIAESDDNGNSLTDVTYQEEAERQLDIITTQGVVMTTCMDFLKQTSDAKSIQELYENHVLVGNFIIKYLPRLYKHKWYGDEIINYIMTKRELARLVQQSQQPAQ